MNVAALRLLAAASDNIRVANVEMPEQNGGTVIIKYLHNVVVNNQLRDAYVFEINADFRYLMDEHTVWFKAFVHGPNEVILQFPSLPYTDLFDATATLHGRRVVNIDDPHNIERDADTMLRHDVLANQEQQWTTVCF